MTNTIDTSRHIYIAWISIRYYWQFYFVGVKNPRYLVFVLQRNEEDDELYVYGWVIQTYARDFV